MSTVGCFDLTSSSIRDVKMNHHICKSAKRTVAGARVKCYSLLVETKVLSSDRWINAEQVTVLKNVNVIDGTDAPE